MVIEGPAGAGKTSLLAAAHRWTENTGVRVVDDGHTLERTQLLELAATDGRGPQVLVAFRRGEPGADEAGLDALWTARGATRMRLGPLELWTRSRSWCARATRPPTMSCAARCIG